MFFLLSKLLSFLLTPLFWVFLLLCIALFTKQATRKKGYLILGIILLFIFSNAFIFNEIVQKWEAPFTKLQDVGKYDYAIVLGGFSSYDTAYSRVKFTEAGDRLWQALQLYHQKKVKKLFISGGSGLLLHQDATEADKIKPFLLSINIPESDVIIEMTSRNTRENAVNTASWLKKHDPAARCLLVTSASHMRRAMGCYKKTGVNVTSYATHRLSEPRKFSSDVLFLPKAIVLSGWDSLIKEWVGYLAYTLVGYI